MSQITSVYADPSTDSATISWEGDMAGIGELDYGTSPTVKPNVVRDDVLALAHSVRVTGLSADTDYYFTVKNIDPDSGDTDAKDGSFHTVVVVPGSQLVQPDALPRRVIQ